MRVETRTEATRTLEKAKLELRALSRMAASEIELVASEFEGLAGHTETILRLAGAIVTCVETESVSAVLPKLQTLGAAAKCFMEDRLQATDGILDTVSKEVKLLRQLSQTTRGQAAIAFETKALSVLTNIEVARLGAVGAGFHYLAHELAEFSKSVIKDTQQLAVHADGRKAAVERTARVLAAEVPRLREELACIEGDLSNALSMVESGLAHFSSIPVQFGTSVSDLAQQIAGVVAAVQAHDITHQQVDHVQEALTIVSAKISSEGNSEDDLAQELGRAYGGLTIQIYQLNTVRETISNWASQIRTCIGGILRVSASDVVGIGFKVLDQERELSDQLARIECLERQSQAHSGRIQSTFGGLSSLRQLVSEYLQRSKSVRSHLQLLTFNSIIEASGLGTQAAAILAIAQSIKGISAEWSEITAQSEQVMQEVLNLEQQMNEAMKTFSEASNERLRETQVQITDSLDHLRTAAAFAEERAQEMKVATEKMQTKTTEISSAVDRLEACFGRIDAALTTLEGVRRELETDDPEVAKRYDAVEIEQLFSASYTTEMERDVLRAALRGSELPVTQPTFGGNGVEMF